MNGVIKKTWGIMTIAAVAYAVVILGFDAATGALLKGATSESNNEIALSALMSGLGFAAFIGLLAVEVHTYRSVVCHADVKLEGGDRALLGFAIWFFGNLPLSLANAFVQICASTPLSSMESLLVQIALSLGLLAAIALRLGRK